MAVPLIPVAIHIGIALVAGAITKVATKEAEIITEPDGSFNLKDGVSWTEAGLIVGGTALVVGAGFAIRQTLKGGK